jgi:ATP-dependent DNA helicase RecG
MSDAELEALLGDIEADWTERKQSDSDKDKLCEAVCAFANDLPDRNRPGVLFVGVTDAGVPSGLAVTDQLLTRLASMPGEGNILPFPSIDVQKRRLKSADVAVVIVHPSSSPPAASTVGGISDRKRVIRGKQDTPTLERCETVDVAVV